ncbi:lipid asymmetry maintenance protein MlaB [Rosenbergiella collisarenosi]|uniref:lipid asymmetry maintenance protein MlaB n=1 Tax=Rosenbergiella collisarenosi TaxID=1544695 RepID=UPI001BDAFE6E|nr:lipid asymmetry maintenance protein MlaB [Rosenbergiella collisarenosi]MBT0719762.1 lipid asymmetry maintenance protein MlaB [Rosenbergiella collisarenosi]
MSQALRWQCEEGVLSLQGELVHNSLSELWQQRRQALSGVKIIDVSRLSRVDSAGLALLVHFSTSSADQEVVALQGVIPALHSLIMLYNLSDVLSYQVGV